MARLVAALALACLAAGCATLASDRAVVACQAADGATTAYAVSHGAQEGNPLMARVLGSAGLPGLFLVKAALVVLIVRYVQNDTAKAAASALGCGAAVHNLLVMGL